MQQLLRPDDEPVFEAERPEALVLACGAIAREVLAVVRLNGWTNVTVRCLPAKLHSRPETIAPAVDAKLSELDGRYERVFVAYADCGTSGALDEVLARHGAERLAGAHCYELFAGPGTWDDLQREEPGTFYLTDFLTRHFDALVVRGLGLDRYPELLGDVFANYRRVVYLAQTDDPALRGRATAAADRLGLPLEVRLTGYGDLHPELHAFVERVPRG